MDEFCGSCLSGIDGEKINKLIVLEFQNGRWIRTFCPILSGKDARIHFKPGKFMAMLLLSQITLFLNLKFCIFIMTFKVLGAKNMKDATKYWLEIADEIMIKTEDLFLLLKRCIK
jgi:hypothetical protein